MERFADDIAKICLDKYKSLNKTGKPTDKEWTVLSGIVLRRHEEKLTVVSLATGTKCLGEADLRNTELYDRGCRVSDSHAEVLARRAFLRYLYDQIDLLLEGLNSDIFSFNDDKKIVMKDGVSFHFFSSQPPCGDCSIFPKNFDENYLPPTKIKKHSNDECVGFKSKDEESLEVKDIHRTGAKCVKAEKKQDPRLSGADYHVTGPLRTKPGRGDPTLSLSCSDKIAKWNILGLQGSLLSVLIPRITIESITIGADCPFSLEAMERGLYTRFQSGTCNLRIMQARHSFMHIKSSRKDTQPCPSSIAWCAVRKRNTEIIVEGRKQGATRKKRGNLLLVSRRALFRTFLITCDKYGAELCNIRHPKKITYIDCKRHAEEYQKAWVELRRTTFSTWPSKPDCLQMFTL